MRADDVVPLVGCLCGSIFFCISNTEKPGFDPQHPIYWMWRPISITLGLEIARQEDKELRTILTGECKGGFEMHETLPLHRH